MHHTLEKQSTDGFWIASLIMVIVASIVLVGMFIIILITCLKTGKHNHSSSIYPASPCQTLEEIEKEIKSLTRPIIAELRSYISPPPVVHMTMIAVYLLLGEIHMELKEWNNIVLLLSYTGNNSLVSRLESYKKPGDETIINNARELISHFTEIEVKAAGPIVSCLFAWAMHMVCANSN